MKYWTLISAALKRKQTRTVLTICSITVAFVLFGTLRSIAVAFTEDVDFSGDDRLVVMSKLSSSQRKEHVETALNIVSLVDRASHKPNELSGGQQQRVAIARALVSDPDMLICDEPTGDLDRETSTEILSLLQVLNRDHGKTILMVTHDPAAAEFAKRILHLDKGKLSY